MILDIDVDADTDDVALELLPHLPHHRLHLLVYMSGFEPGVVEPFPTQAGTLNSGSGFGFHPLPILAPDSAPAPKPWWHICIWIYVFMHIICMYRNGQTEKGGEVELSYLP